MTDIVPVHPSNKFFWLTDQKMAVSSVEHYMKGETRTETEVEFDANGVFFIKSVDTSDCIKAEFKPQHSSKEYVTYLVTEGPNSMLNWKIRFYMSDGALVKSKLVDPAQLI